MKSRFLKAVFAGLALSVSSLSANAGVIDASSVLLDDANATQLESWLGQGDLDWDSIWYGTSGATATSWHASVDQAGPTVSIYDINFNGQNFLIGGYTDLSWGNNAGYLTGSGNSFLFNLNIPQKIDNDMGTAEIGAFTNYFATFGGINGFLDIYGGQDAIGVVLGSTVQCHYAFDSCYAGINRLLGEYSGINNFSVNALETFTFSAATSVPEPSTLVIFALGMIGLASRRVLTT